MTRPETGCCQQVRGADIAEVRGISMTANVTEVKFDNDLLISPGDIGLAEFQFQSVTHVLDHEELKSLFRQHDAAALRAKFSSRCWGFASIVLGVIALWGASAEPLLQHLNPHVPGAKEAAAHVDNVWNWPRIIGLASAAMGIFCVLVGPLGLFRGKRKRDWIYNRLMIERIRQFHFQTFACHWPAIEQSLESDQAKTQYRKDREQWLARFKQRHLGRLSAVYTELLDEGAVADWRLHDQCDLPPKSAEKPKLEPLFAAYRELRLVHQIQYANHMLRDEQKWYSTAPRTLSGNLTTVAIVATGLLIALHIIIAVILARGDAVPLLLEFIHVGAIWIAIFALGARALEEGFQPTREVERYKAYRSRVTGICDRFDAAQTATEKLELMHEMEHMVHEDLREFTRLAHEAKFII